MILYMDRTTHTEASMTTTTYIFDRDPELAAEPLGIFTADDGRIYVTVSDEIECGVEPIGILTPCPNGCDDLKGSCDLCV